MDSYNNIETINTLVIIFSVLAALLAMVMLFARKAIVSSVALLGVLLCTAFIYGMINEHFIAAIQLVVYAGAIMVFFIFSIMLLNFQEESRKQHELVKSPYLLLVAGTAIFSCMGVVMWAILNFFSNPNNLNGRGEFTLKRIEELGGNSQVIAMQLFTTHSLIFEVISIILLTAIVSAVVLAKRRFVD